MRPCKNQGFVSILAISFLSVFIAAILFLTAGATQIQLQKKLFQLCQLEGLTYLNKVSNELNKLMDLNPAAEALIQSKLIQEILLAEAISTGNFELVPTIQARIIKIKLRQEKLAMRQHKYIGIAEKTMSQGALITDKILRREAQKIEHQTSILKIHWVAEASLSGKIPVQPTSSEIAPIFVPTLPTVKTSLMDHSWQWQLQVDNPWSKWLHANWRIKKQCLVGIKFTNQFTETTVVKL